jgi:hypothetical protein
VNLVRHKDQHAVRRTGDLPTDSRCMG